MLNALVALAALDAVDALSAVSALGVVGALDARSAVDVLGAVSALGAMDTLGAGCSRAAAGRQGMAVSHGGEHLPWLAPRFPDDKQLRESDLQKVKFEGKVHYLRDELQGKRPCGTGK